MPGREPMKRRARGRDHATKNRRPTRRARRSTRKPRAAAGVPCAGRGREASVAVVAIGASAGGFDALRRFFSAARSDGGTAFIIVQHLDPIHESLAAEVIGRYTPMPVVQAGSDTPVKA